MSVPVQRFLYAAQLFLVYLFFCDFMISVSIIFMCKSIRAARVPQTAKLILLSGFCNMDFEQWIWKNGMQLKGPPIILIYVLPVRARKQSDVGKGEIASTPGVPILCKAGAGWIRLSRKGEVWWTTLTQRIKNINVTNCRGSADVMLGNAWYASWWSGQLACSGGTLHHAHKPTRRKLIPTTLL